jgi:hypothetical protein
VVVVILVVGVLYFPLLLLPVVVMLVVRVLLPVLVWLPLYRRRVLDLLLL